MDLAIKVACERISVAIRSGCIDVLPTLECLTQWKHERYSLVTFAIHWCNAVRESGRSDQEAGELIQLALRIGFRQHHTPQAVIRKHPSQIFGYILHFITQGDWDESSTADALLAYVTFIEDSENTQELPVDAILVATDLDVTPRLAMAIFYAMGVATFSSFERRGVDRLVRMTARLGPVPDQILATPHFTLYWSTLICDWATSSSRPFLPDNYTEVLFTLTCDISKIPKALGRVPSGTVAYLHSNVGKLTQPGTKRRSLRLPSGDTPHTIPLPPRVLRVSFHPRKPGPPH